MHVEHGRIVLASLEYFLTDRCNLRCEHCAASSPYLRDANMPDVSAFRKELAALAPALRAKQIKFLGGEPLMNPAICEFLVAARESGLFERVRVTTNGTLLSRMSDEFFRLADIVELCRYPGVTEPDEAGIERLAERAARAGSTLEVSRIDRFMIATCDEPLDEARAAEVFASCGEARDWSCHLLYRGRIYRCSRVHTLDRYLAERGIAHPPFTELDGLLVDEREALAAELRDYLGAERPLAACRHCLGTSGRWVENAQISVEEVRRRRAAPPRPLDPDALVDPREAALRAMINTWAAAFDLKGRG